MFIIGDVHGHFNELIGLLSKLPDWKNSGICFVGDLVDRGLDSLKVVELVKKLCEDGIADCIIGNHELMFMSWYYDYISGNEKISQLSQVFLMNGGVETLNSYKDENDEYLLDKMLEHIKFIESLEFYKVYDDIKINDRKLVVSHSTVLSPNGNLIDKIEYSRYKALNHLITTGEFQTVYGEITNKIVWNRMHPTDDHLTFNIYGHTPKRKPSIGNYYANIDTGVYIYGSLTAIHFPSLEVYQLHK